MRTHADRGGEGIALEIHRRRIRCRAAMTAIATVGARRTSHLDDAVDVGGSARVALAALVACVRRRWVAVALRTSTRGRCIGPSWRRVGAARVGQFAAMTVDVAARGFVPRRWARATATERRDIRQSTKANFCWRRDRNAVVNDVAVVVPILGNDVTLGAGNIGRSVRRVCVAGRSVAMTGHARRWPSGVAGQARNARRASVEVAPVAARTQREVPILLFEERAVKIRTRRVDDVIGMNHWRAISRTHAAERARVIATRNKQGRDHDEPAQGHKLP